MSEEFWQKGLKTIAAQVKNSPPPPKKQKKKKKKNKIWKKYSQPNLDIVTPLHFH